ncbi:MAG: hypothetical protein SNJ77_11360 [Cytophagales bacterium]
MVKNIVFNRHLKKRVPLKQGLLGYDNAQRIGILINADEDCFPKVSNSIVEEIKKDGKQVEVVVYASVGTNVNYHFEHILLLKSDFKWNGKLNNEKVSKFCSKNLDLLYVINSAYCFEVDYVALLSQASCKVGAQRLEQKVFFDLMVSMPNQSQDSLFSHLHFYSKKIK